MILRCLVVGRLRGMRSVRLLTGWPVAVGLMSRLRLLWMLWEGVDMRVEEVPRLLQVASVYQANLREAGEPEVLVRAWYMALDTRLQLEEALNIVASLAASGERLHPSTINAEFLRRSTPLHQQGGGRPHLPGEVMGRREVSGRAPVEIGEDVVPVRPDEVPEYVKARSRARQAEATARQAWSVPCSYCGAAAGERCHTGDGSTPLRRRLAHPSREDAAQRAMAGV